MRAVGEPSNLVKEESILKGSLSKPTRRLTVLGVVAVLALSLAVVTASAGASIWHAASAGDAVAAKKKCKKKKHRSASAAKKKKCKKKHHVTPAPPAPQPRGPIVRLDITWSGDAEIDAHAWSSGLHDGWNDLIGDYQAEIPGTTFETSSNHEKITELNPNPTIKPLTFGVCYYPSSDEGTTDITATTVFSDGVSHTQVLTADFGDAFTSDPQEGGPPDPFDEWCPSPF
jgi:hypothetical protein